jgi:protein gp37
MNATKIQYCDMSWSPVTGCTDELPCWAYCWARRMAARQRGRNGYPADEPFRPTFHPDRLGEPARHKKPKRIAVCFMGDIFNAAVPRKWRYEVMRAVKSAPQHTYLFLTKRPHLAADEIYWPEYPNLWIGTSVDDQATADARIPHLLRCMAANRWLSIEPMRGPVDLRSECRPWGKHGAWAANLSRLHWLVLGGGPFPVHPDWVRSVRNQCQAAGVPFFFKQWGGVRKREAGRMLDGRVWEQLPHPRPDRAATPPAGTLQLAPAR